ncbi:HNH endonuclease [Microbispora sp. NBC_01189]|uniref:HNH endonuclease signature motif containing protein n=1 Tax=Microbispora sp. NBC_01189 TaxID=2903583 RepID=UPI002E13B249|nr:HNH endonuclease [Microbispora sp. NBC_01189]
MAALVEAARVVALVPVPEDAGVCLAEAEELLAVRDRITSALAARVGRVHRAGEAKSQGHASTKLWLRSAGGMTPAGAGRLLTMSMELHRLAEVCRLFAEGGLAEGVVEAICTATSGLTDDQATIAERILLELANSAGAAEVAKAGRYLRAVLDPDGHEKDEQADFDRRFFRVRRRRGGGLEGEFYLPVEAAARLRHMLDVYAKPKADGDDRTLSVRNADALIAFLENKIATELLVLVNAESLPDDHPGTDPTSTDLTADGPIATGPAADHPSGTDSSSDPSADHPTRDPAGPGPSPGSGPSGTHPSKTGPSDTDPGDEPGPAPGFSGTGSAPGPFACATEGAGTDACATCSDTTASGPGSEHFTSDTPVPYGEHLDPGHFPAAPGGEHRAGDAPVGESTHRESDAHLHDGERFGSDATLNGDEHRATDFVGENPATEAPASSGECDDPARPAAAEPDMQRPPAGGDDTWPGDEAWPGGDAWAGAGGNSPPGVGVNAPPGVWLRGLPGLILATGHLLPASGVHRLARTSTLVRIVMNAAGQVLDMGRKVRLATPAQRRAVFARYATCWVDGCPLPATLCQIDHAEDWCSGGLTDLKLLGPACQFHNRDRYRHPTRYTRRTIGDDRWAFTYRNPRSARRSPGAT